MMRKGHLEQLAEYAKKHDLWVLDDSAYEDFVWVDEPGLGWVFNQFAGYNELQAQVDYREFLDGLEGPRLDRFPEREPAARTNDLIADGDAARIDPALHLRPGHARELGDQRVHPRPDARLVDRERERRRRVAHDGA